MRTIAMLAASVVVLATTTSAQTVTYYMHKSGSSVGVPGGSTNIVIDENAPVGSTPVTEAASVSKGVTIAFPTFIAPTFATDTTLGLDFDVTVHVSSNLAMNNNCAILRALIEHVDSGGARTFLAQGTVLAGIPQGGANGTVGFQARNIPVSVGCDRPQEDVTVHAGESIAVTVSVTNACKANRTVWLAYDSTSAPSTASFSPTLPPDDVFIRACFARCQHATATATVKFFTAKHKCVVRCEANYRKGIGSSSDCLAPYAGLTATCITDPLKGAEAKASLAIRKACNLTGRCPTCYAGGDCTTFADDWVLNIEGQLDSFVPGIWCDPTTDPPVGKCMDYTGNAIWKYYGARQKCYDKCFTNEAKGLVAADSCNAPASDPVTVACIGIAASKATAAIDKYCADSGVAPSCGDSYPSGANWTSLASIASDDNMPLLYCASP